MANPAYQAARALKNRDKILESALPLFLERGYENTPLIELAQAANVSTATLFKHFPEKKQILLGAIETLASMKDEDAGQNQNMPMLSDEGLRLIGMAYGRRLDHPLMLGLIRLGITLGATMPELGPMVTDAWRKPYTARLEILLEAATERGDWRIPDRGIAVRQFFGLITDQILWPRLLGLAGATPTPQRRLIVDEAVRTFVSRYAATIRTSS